MPTLPRRIEKVSDPSPPQDFIEERVFLDDEAGSQRSYDRMDGEPQCNPGCGEQAGDTTPRQSERGEIGHIGPRRKLKCQNGQQKRYDIESLSTAHLGA